MHALGKHSVRPQPHQIGLFRDKYLHVLFSREPHRANTFLLLFILTITLTKKYYSSAGQCEQIYINVF